jgi:hypothetical protein
MRRWAEAVAGRTHPRRGDRQTDPAVPRFAGSVRSRSRSSQRLIGGQALSHDSLQRLKLDVASEPDALDNLWPLPGRGRNLRPDAVFTVRTYGNISPPYGHGLVRNFNTRE